MLYDSYNMDAGLRPAVERDRREARPDGTILGSATRELRLAIEATASRVTVAAGTPVFDHGDPGDALYVIEKGEIEISVHSLDGRKLALDVMGEGEVFGEIALFGGNRTAAAAALTDCVLRRIRRSDVMAAVRKDPELAFDFIDVLCGRLRALSEKLEERSFLPVPVRLANRLVYLDRKFGAGRAADDLAVRPRRARRRHPRGGGEDAGGLARPRLDRARPRLDPGPAARPARGPRDLRPRKSSGRATKAART